MLVKISLFKLIRLSGCVILLIFIISFIIVQLNRHHQLSENPIQSELSLNQYLALQVNQHKNSTTRVLYAVFSSNTPNGVSYRSYDYAFYLPLTALAWERVGFRSIVLIAGSRCEWDNDPALSVILAGLEKINAIVIFIPTPLTNRMMISQTSRLFVSNLIGFPGNNDDYVITTDSDLWPIHREHYTPKSNHQIVLVHSACCGNFQWNGTSYTMLPMSNIGTSVSTWKQIINFNHRSVNDSQSIIKYFERMFGSRVNDPIIVGEPEWYMDQQMVSIRIAEWVARNNNKYIYKVSDEGFKRIDRESWNADELDEATIQKLYDAHLPIKPFLPEKWKTIRPLVKLLYVGSDSWKVRWCDQYAKEFYSKVHNYVTFNDLD